MKSRHRDGLNFQAAVLDSVGEAVIATRMDGKILYWNKAAERIYGWTQAEVIGRNIIEITLPDENDEQAVEIMRKLQAGEVWSGEFRVRHRAGHSFLAYVTDTCLKNKKGELAVIIGVSYDLTERKCLEAQKQSLEEEVYKQRAAIAAAEKERSEAESRFKSEFIAHMSHEIRTPLAAIKGYAELISSSHEGSENLRQWGQTIVRASQQLENLVNEVLDLSKIAAGKLRIENEFFALSEFKDDLGKLFFLKAKEKQLDLQIRAEGNGSLKIKTDPLRLRQILVNLVGNAIKFTEQGSVLVDFSLEKAPAKMGRQRLQVLVRDSGIGIPREDRQVIFEAFRQSVLPRRSVEGTGLGLSLSAALAQKLGGSLELLHSEVGKGSSFLLSIPVEISRSSPEKTEPVGSEGRSNFHGKKILIVEDSDDVRALLEFILKSHDAEVATACNGLRCLDALKTHSFDLITMDLEMPIVDGYQALRLLREAGYKMPVIAVSAKVLPGERERCLALGFSDYFAKPIDIQRLLRLAH